MTAPHAQVCEKAGVSPGTVKYTEAHGTGTVAGDGQELGALDAVYARSAGRTAAEPLLIGSVKSNMGHCEGASGLAGGRTGMHAVLCSVVGRCPIEFEKLVVGEDK